MSAGQGAPQPESELRQGGEEQQDKRNDGPIERPSGKAKPARDEEDEREWIDQGPAQIVEDLPARNAGDRIGDPAARFIGNAGKHPLRNLPVAAHPAVFAAVVGAVVRRVVVDKLDVGGQACARIGAFDQVVAQQGIARKAAVEHGVKRCNFIDSLAGKNALAKEILVGIGDGARINIESALAGVDGGQPRARGGLDGDADARLQNAVASGDNAQLRDR